MKEKTIQLPELGNADPQHVMAGIRFTSEHGINQTGTLEIETPEPVLQDKTITENGTYTADEGYDGFDEITVNVEAPDPVLQDKSITENGTYGPDEGYDGLNNVTVNVEAPDPVLQDKTITTNGTYVADDGYDGFNEITVDVEIPEPVLQDITITENGTYAANESYDGFDNVTVNVPQTLIEDSLEYGEITLALADEEGNSLWDGTSYTIDYYITVPYNADYSVVTCLPRNTSSAVNSMTISDCGIYLSRVLQGAEVITETETETTDENAIYKWTFVFSCMKVPDRDVVIGVNIYE